MGSSPAIYLFILLHIFQGVRGAKFTFVNKCSQTIWPAIVPKSGSPKLQTVGFELPIGSSFAFQAPANWSGRFWGRTGCTFDDSGQGTCATGACDSGEIDCKGTNSTATTLIEFTLGLASMDFYDVSLVDGYNLPVMVEAISGSGRCASTGCVEDLNQRCPAELKIKGGGACRSACEVFKTEEYCCTGDYGSPDTCRPSFYSQVFKSACPKAFSYPFDDATSLFSCTAADYVCTFCPPRSSSSAPSPSTEEEPKASPEIVPAPDPSPETPGSFPWPSLMGIIGGLLLGITITTALAIKIVKSRRSKSNSEEERNRIVEKFILQQEYLAPKRYKYSEIKKMTKSLSDKLGQGGYGSVYKGMLPNGCLVAVKVLFDTNSNGEEFINEVASISRTSHVNIVNLLGFCFDKTKRALVYEYMPNKSLDKFISSSADCLLDLGKLYKIAVGVAKGLEYLHTGCNTRIVHFDIKPQNILLDEDFCPKISDFGLAKLCKKKQSILSMLGARGTIGYIAPEIFSRNFGGVSHKSDVYSYGMMILEMAGARKIEEAETTNFSENYFPDKIYEQLVAKATEREDDIMVDEEEEKARKMVLVGFWCIQATPSNRPAMSKVVEMLEGSIQYIQIPPKPTLFCPNNLSRREISPSLSEYEETENSDEDSVE